MSQRLPAFEAATKFIETRFPNCAAALLCGSVVRGQATETSDLDLVIFDETLLSPYRSSVLFEGWPIEMFVHNLWSYKDFFKSDAERARPSIIRMVAEGVPIRDNGILGGIKEEAAAILVEGPKEWTEEIIRTKRYMLTDLLDDFMGAQREEGIFIAGALAELIHEFFCRTNKRWIGMGKWIPRALKEVDPEFAVHFTKAFDTYYSTDRKESIIELTDLVLQPHGGRLFDGYTLGK
ncbi:nucleotidyltransferase domain-containing protein [Chungangia koreensis]|uniref:Nucleotidyltransferase domain-containing protein n=1 Tax=Chungangia koreensis TaxID=752657 RepID=A0ABV8X8H9_9LACT